MLLKIKNFLKPGAEVKEQRNYLEVAIENPSKGVNANAYYFNNVEWAEEYLKYCHRSETFKSRWEKAVGSLEDKVVVDIGCGPGNIFATLDKKPKLLIGVDVAPNSLEIAKQFGYVPVLADAENLPFISGFADVVTLNAALHHCDNMEAILKEAGRLVKPGGRIVTDHDPQLSAWNYKGPAKLLWNARLIYYRFIGHGFHKSGSQQLSALASEVHHKPGHGVTKQLFENALKPLGFSVAVFPHNHTLGAEIFDGQIGKAEFKYRLGNILSGRNPNNKKSALSLMCIAIKNA